MIIPTIKVVSAFCNLRCSYCYYNQTDQSRRIIIRPDVLENLILKTIGFVSGNVVSFVWHGGEPLAAGIDLYEKILNIERASKSSKEISNQIQTNATLITQEWAGFLAENKFKVGISVDGPKGIHDANRVFASGRGSHDSVMRGLKNLNGAGIMPGAIALVTRSSLGREQEILSFFSDSGIKRFLLKPCFEINPATGRLSNFSVTPDEFVDFMTNIFEFWIRKDDPSIEIRNLSQPMLGMLGGRPSLCEFSGRCDLFPTIEYDGAVSACDSFPLRKYYFGNINEKSWDDLLSSAGANAFGADMRRNKEQCGGCRWLNICNGGCPRYSFSLEEDSWHKNVFCSSKLRLFDYIEKRINQIKRG